MAIFDLNALSRDFPENKIVLLNGEELVCYPKAGEPQTPDDPQMRLDTTGVYLRLGKSRPQKPVAGTPIPEKELFLRHAFLFFRNAHRILSDSRMFLAPVPIQSGLAYTGTSGLRAPTLGVYIEWWINCDVEVTKDKDGNDALTYHIAGSPLSGRNHCSRVYPDGRTETFSFPSPFSPIWRSLATINSRYNTAKVQYESFSLQEVIDILDASEEDSGTEELRSRLLIQKGMTNKALRWLSRLEEQHSLLKEKFQNLCLDYYKKELTDFADEYERRSNQVEGEIARMEEEKADFKKQMRQGLITNVEYQRHITPITRRKNNLRFELSVFRMEKTNKLIASGYITYAMIDSFLAAKKL